MNKNNYYFSLFIHDGTSIGEIDELIEDYPENPCKEVVDMFAGLGLEEDKDNLTNYVPYIGSGDTCIDTYEDWVLVRNIRASDIYLLYRKAYQDEVDWLNKN